MNIHINYGFSKRDSEPWELCMFCEKHAQLMAYTYFGAPVCESCWEGVWRKKPDGECDPPFAEITNNASGQWLDVSTENRQNRPTASGWRERGAIRRVLSVVFPWYVLWRLRQLSSTPMPDQPLDQWFRGYERAMWEVRLNLGCPDSETSGVPTVAGISDVLESGHASNQDTERS